MKLNWNFQRHGRETWNQKPSMGEGMDTSWNHMTCKKSDQTKGNKTEKNLQGWSKNEHQAQICMQFWVTHHKFPTYIHLQLPFACVLKFTSIKSALNSPHRVHLRTNYHIWYCQKSKKENWWLAMTKNQLIKL